MMILPQVSIASLFEAGDVLFGKLRPYLAKVHLASHRGLVSTEALVIRSKEVVIPNFLWYFMASKEFINEVNGSTFGTKMPRASWDFIGNLNLLLPPLTEQKAIVNFLDNQIKKIDNQREKVGSAIHKLQEYRSALITNAVTGKIDVRDFKLPTEITHA